MLLEQVELEVLDSFPHQPMLGDMGVVVANNRPSVPQSLAVAGAVEVKGLNQLTVNRVKVQLVALVVLDLVVSPSQKIMGVMVAQVAVRLEEQVV